MMFEEWWKQHDYSEHHKKECRKAYNAGMEDNFLHANRELKDRDVIINFLKKELQKKTYCRQVMKRQYRELRQKYDSLLKDYKLMQSCNNCKHHHTGGCPYAQTKDCNWKNKKHWELCK